MPKIQPWHKTELLEPEYTRVDLVKEGANSQAHIKLFKSKGGIVMNPEEVLAKLDPAHRTVLEKAIKDAQDAEAVAKDAADKAQKELKDLQEKEAIDKSASEEDILKSVKDPAVKALLETQILKAKTAEAEVKKAREAALTQEAIAKAAEVPAIGAEQEGLVELYKKLKIMDEGVCEEVFGIFKAASALATSGGVFTEVGKTASNNDAPANEEAAWAAIEKAAVEIAKTRNITQASAVNVAINENPALYSAYLNAQQA